MSGNDTQNVHICAVRSLQIATIAHRSVACIALQYLMSFL